MTSKTVYSDVGSLTDKEYTSIEVKDVTEVFQDYKKPALMVCTAHCDFKCCKDAGYDVCHNMKVAKQRGVFLPFARLLNMVNKSTLTDAVLFGGLEPFLQADELVQCIEYLRAHGMTKDIVIYTGYDRSELDQKTLLRLSCSQVIVKFGRYVPNSSPVFDPILGIILASDNQYGVYCG